MLLMLTFFFQINWDKTLLMGTVIRITGYTNGLAISKIYLEPEKWFLFVGTIILLVSRLNFYIIIILIGQIRNVCKGYFSSGIKVTH